MEIDVFAEIMNRDRNKCKTVSEVVIEQDEEIQYLKERIEAYQDYINDHMQEWKTVTKTADDNETTVTIRSRKQVTSIGVYFANEEQEF